MKLKIKLHDTDKDMVELYYTYRSLPCLMCVFHTDCLDPDLLEEITEYGSTNLKMVIDCPALSAPLNDED